MLSYSNTKKMGADSLGILFSVNGETCALIIFKQVHHTSGDCENYHHKIDHKGTSPMDYPHCQTITNILS